MPPKTPMIGALVILLAGCAGVLTWRILPKTRVIASYTLDDGSRVLIWSQEEWMEPHVPLYYRIGRNGVDIVSAKFLGGLDRGQHFDFRTANAEDGRFWSVFEVKDSERSELMIIFDRRLQMAYPSHSDYDRSNVWIEAYQGLRLTNPEFPRSPYFESVSKIRE